MMKEGGLRGMYEEFISELYNVNEGGERKYESLIKLMETVGLIQNRRIKKESFRNDKAIVERAITAGLHEMTRGGSNYKAMEAIEEALNVDPSFVSAKTGKSPEELKAVIAAKRAASNKLVTKADVERDRAIQALAQGEEERSADPEGSDIEEGAEGEVIVGMDLLNHPPFDVINDKFNNQGPWLQPLPGSDANTMISTKGHLYNYVERYKKFFGNEPNFKIDEKNKAIIVNPEYNAKTNSTVAAKTADAENAKKKGWSQDETTDATSSGQSTGALSDVKDAEHKSNAADSIKHTNYDFEDAEIDETTSMGGPSGINANGNSIEYDTPGFKKNDFMMAGNKENLEEDYNGNGVNINISENTPYEAFAIAVADVVNSDYGSHNVRPFLDVLVDKLNLSINEDAFSDTQWEGGSFVKPKDKCAKYPYCNQGADAIETKKTKGSVISNDAMYEAVAKKTGRTIEEVKEIIELNNK